MEEIGLKIEENHTHNGSDSPKIDFKDVENAIDEDTVVKLTGAQTIADVKTFTSIPVLPASDPTADNQAVRKSYVDNLIGDYVIVPSDNLVDSADDSSSTSSSTYSKRKEIDFNEIDGRIRVSFEMGTSVTGTGVSVSARIYVNGVAVGTEQTRTNIEISDGYVEYTEDIDVETDDSVQLYAKFNSPFGSVAVKNFRLYYDKSFDVTPGTINLN